MTPNYNKKKCHNCGNSFKKLSLHWNGSNECQEPSLTKRQKKIIKGLLMGDGYIVNDNNSNYFSIEMKNKEFLEWLDFELGNISTGLRSKKENTYVLNTRNSMDFFDTLREWYSTGEKKFPEDLELDPIKTSMWYVSDGTKFKHTENSKPQLRIACSNESDRLEELMNLFEQEGIKSHTAGDAIEFNTGNSKKLIDYMGSAPKGFERKWF